MEMGYRVFLDASFTVYRQGIKGSIIFFLPLYAILFS